jgi:hypothetical protein
VILIRAVLRAEVRYSGLVPQRFLSALCRTFHKASQGRLLLSGGNDAQLVLWSWADSAAQPQWQGLFGQDAAEEPAVPIRIDNHGRNINCVHTCDIPGFNIVVADTSSILTLHSVL